MKRLLCAATLLIVGCTSSSSPVSSSPAVDSAPAAERPAESMQVTFYVAGMNQRLQIL